MADAPIAPVVLVILDGWGERQSKTANAIAQGKTPVVDSLREVYPLTFIQASGKAVGLPEGQMGNSEVGHLNIGAGRVVPQELVRISDAVEDGSILENPVLVETCQKIKASDGKLHLMGLCSTGGVHSHISHLLGLLKLAKAQEISEVCIHVFTDGRDTNPTDGVSALEAIQNYIQQAGVGKIVTISGRYYAMDRDRRWDRVQKAYEVITETECETEIDPIALLKEQYESDVTDEFIAPTRVAAGGVEAGDGVIFFNFRPDRARELTSAFVNPDFDGFEREQIQPLHFATFTQYDASLPVEVAFKPQNLTNILGEVIANAGLKQLRTAETEKYPHVTYFFNGGEEEPFQGEDRKLINSPMVSTYDKAPAMSAEAVTDLACEAVEQGIYSLVVINYANPDMVGHTGNLEAAISAIETVDHCVGRLLESISKMGGTALITADHGNSEYMADEKGNPWTAHTTNLVPFLLVEGEKRKIPQHGGKVELRDQGCLADIAPTILEILQIPQPEEMTGRSLIASSNVQVKPNRTPVDISL
ncbi:phosphoglycerate mutase [Halothece sp. PCC 7418]|uniref:2,3-bisphosphoglycerate-independent phosphoglycerate mutase n=1 Tax=Halothece sp. (strain PCC 7418) TaxID=65093 RepID=UPI0002A088EA|nr:2,3-bisphosphoglycerate-independent phosphoglycerate mutase [Halothece sp. PCC 7418]AFZ45284.1 phosphoglycerate mutase [Halothece sp. PCC 7418]